MSFSWSVGVKNICDLNYEKLENLTEQPGNLIHLIEARVSQCFNERLVSFSVEVNFDDPTTNVPRHRALAIAKPTPRGY